MFAKYSPLMLSIAFAATNTLITKPLKLENSVLKLLDGVTYALDGPCMTDMLCIRREVRKIQFGERDAETKILRGHYLYEESFCSIHQLAQIEDEIEREYASKRKVLKQQEGVDRCALQAVEEERMVKIEALQPCLRAAKDDFKRINAPYLESIRGTKSMMVILVEESCDKRGRQDSFLMQWAHVAEGKEFDSFEDNMKTFRDLDTFCTDLTNFMDDVVYSCPKGCAQAGLNIPR